MTTTVENVSVQKRQVGGTRASRRLRREGQIPAVLYGHGKETVSLTVPADQVSAALRHGSRVVQLSGDLSERALLREIQWDPFGMQVLHLDLMRVEAGDRVRTTVSVELRGDAPGVHEGGIVSLMLHEIDLECPVDSIPDRLEANVRGLHLGQSITAGQLALPEGAKLLVDPSTPVVHCEAVAAEPEEGVRPELAGAAEPEVIGRREGKEEEE
jgi:large subunit ribosomal protein L25